jgi:hypothetical protein
MTSGPVNSQTAYLSTAETIPKEPGELNIKLTNLHTSIANAVNVREICLYQDGQEVLTGQQFSVPGDNNAKKVPYRKAFYFGAIASGATLNITHGIPTIVECTAFKGACVTDVVDYRPLPCVSAVAANAQISVRILGANVEIVNGAASPNITSGKIIVEYLAN